MARNGIPMLDELALKAAEPDPEAQTAVRMLISLVQDGVGRLEGDAIKGFADGFLMEHPEIAKAYTAHKLLERVAHGFTGFIKDVADYLIPIQRKTGKTVRK